MNRFAAIVASLLIIQGSWGIGQDSKDAPVASPESRPQVPEEIVRDTAATPIEREIALVRIAALSNEIDLAKLAYQKSSNEKVRQFASKMEAVHAASRDRLERLAKSAPEVIVRVEKPALPATPSKRAEPESRAAKGEPDPGTEPRKGGGTQDPSFGNKPDAGSLDEYNRNTGNAKGDKEEDRAQLKKALKEQSTPGTLEKKREVEKSAPEGRVVAVESRQELRPADEWVAIQRKIAAKRLVNARRELAAKGGADFDECYLRLVVMTHQQMSDEDEVFADYVSSQRRPLLLESERAATDHIVQAKALIDGLTTEKKGL